MTVEFRVVCASLCFAVLQLAAGSLGTLLVVFRVHYVTRALESGGPVLRFYK